MTTQTIYQATTGAQAAGILQELDRRRQTARDLIIPANSIRMNDEGQFTIPGPFNSVEVLPGKPTAHAQTAEKLNIPRAYYERMRDSQPALLAENFNTWASTDDRAWLLRLLDGEVRANLSDRYRALDAYDLGFATIKTLNGITDPETGAHPEISRVTLTDDRFEMRIIHPTWREDLTYPDGDNGGGAHSIGRSMGKLIPGCYVSTSETGKGKLSIRGFALDLICTNGLVREEAFERIHLGSRNEQGYLTQETREAKDGLIWKEVADLISAMFDRDRFKAWADDLRGATTLKLDEPIAAVDAVVKDSSLTDDDRQAILNELISPSHDRDPGRTVWGLMCAVTERAKIYRETDPEKETALEMLGSQLLRAPRELVKVRA